MARSFACRSPCQNPHDGKDKLIGRTPTKGSDHCTPASAATRAPIPAAAPVDDPLIASGSVNSSVIWYLEDDL